MGEAEPDPHATTLEGCVQVLEIICTVVAVACSLLNFQWLSASGGGYVTLALLLSLAFVLVCFFFHTCCDITGRGHLQSAEWIGYIVTFALLGIAVPVTINAANKQYFEDNGDGRTILLENSHIHGTLVFLLLALMMFGFHFVNYTVLRIQGRRRQASNQKITG